MFKKVFVLFIMMSSVSLAVEATMSKEQLIKTVVGAAQVAISTHSPEKINDTAACLGVSTNKLTDLNKIEHIATQCSANLPDKINITHQGLRQQFISCAKKQAANSLGIPLSKLKQCL